MLETANRLWWDYGWPLLIIVIQSAVLLVALLVIIAFLLLMDRKVWAAVQLRRGPNVVGPFGLLQSFADLIKFVVKEPIIPAGADKAVFLLAPLATAMCALAAWAVIPVSQGSFFGIWDGKWVVADLNVGILYLLAIALYARHVSGGGMRPWISIKPVWWFLLLFVVPFVGIPLLTVNLIVHRRTPGAITGRTAAG